MATSTSATPQQNPQGLIVKLKTMEGYDSTYIPAGIATASPSKSKSMAKLGSKKGHMTVAQIRDACRKYAQKYVDLQSRDFQRLGVFAAGTTLLDHERRV